MYIGMILENKIYIDVTQPPYNIDNTGIFDCTESLCKLFDEIVSRDRDALEATKKKLELLEDPNARISFEIRKTEGHLNLIFPEKVPEPRILYFPNGEYLVSGTVSYSFGDLQNIVDGGRIRHEINRGIHLLGQSRDGVVIKLRDSCPGFELGSRKPVVSFMQGESSNIAMTNTIENMTIEVGENNPGAIGLIFMANNTGAIRNVDIRSTDHEKRGAVGLAMIHEKISGVLAKNIEIDGFDYAIEITPVRNYVVLEHICIRDQRRTGLKLSNTSISIRALKSTNSVPAIRVSGASAHIVLVEGELHGGFNRNHAIECEMGALFLRDINTSGYSGAVSFYGDNGVQTSKVKEYSSHGSFSIE
jgi:hypothetical protein